jgi:PAS domain S-box-containing protein
MLHTILISILILGALLCFSLAILAWQQRPATSATIMSFLLTAIGVYAVGYCLELTGTTLNEMLLAIRLEYLGVVQIAPLWMALALYYANQSEWIKPQRLLLLWIIPIIVLIAVFTNGFHHLYYTSVSINYLDPFPTLTFQRGPFYWLHIVYVYLVFTSATLLLVRQFLFPHVLYRRQATVMMGSSLFVIIVTALHLAGVTPLPNIDINPFAMIISSSIMGWGILNLRLIELTPVAREALFETLIDGVLVLDDQNRLVDFNPSAGRYLNLPADAVGQSLIKFLPTETRPIFENNKPDGSYQEISVGRDDIRYFEVFYDLLVERKNRPTGSLIIFHEITKRKKAEAHLQQTLTRYRLLANNSNDVIWTMDLDGRYTYISPAIERLRGYVPEEVLQQTLEEAFCPGSLPLIKNSLQRALEAARNSHPEPPQYLEIEQPCKNGGTIWTEITTRLILDENGTPTGFMGVSREIGERKRMQDQIQHTLDELTQFNKAMIGREIHMIELKQEVNNLLKNAGLPNKYHIPEE